MICLHILISSYSSNDKLSSKDFNARTRNYLISNLRNILRSQGNNNYRDPLLDKFNGKISINIQFIYIAVYLSDNVRENFDNYRLYQINF